MTLPAHVSRRLGLVVSLATVLAVSPASTRAATIQIVNLDGALEGFNDNTAVAPIGGNPGTTRGAQRLNVFNQAAAVWGARHAAQLLATSAERDGLAVLGLLGLPEHARATREGQVILRASP